MSTCTVHTHNTMVRPTTQHRTTPHNHTHISLTRSSIFIWSNHKNNIWRLLLLPLLYWHSFPRSYRFALKKPTFSLLAMLTCSILALTQQVAVWFLAFLPPKDSQTRYMIIIEKLNRWKKTFRIVDWRWNAFLPVLTFVHNARVFDALLPSANVPCTSIHRAKWNERTAMFYYLWKHYAFTGS